MKSQPEIDSEIDALKALRNAPQFRDVEGVLIDRHLQADAAAAALLFGFDEAGCKRVYSNDYELTAALNAINWRDGDGRPVSELIA